MKKKTLKLRKETLSELTPAELREVVGGAPPTRTACISFLESCGIACGTHSCLVETCV